MTFVDIGAGTGFFSREAATIVGTEGKAIAAEMSPELVEYLRTKGVPETVEVLQSEEYAIPLRTSVADFTWIAFVTHENADLPRFLAEAARITKDGGKIVIVEWKKQEEQFGPPMEERLGEKRLREYLKEFRITGAGSLNPSHYFIELEVKKTTTV